MRKNSKQAVAKNVMKNIQEGISSLQELCLQIEPLIKTAEAVDKEARIFYNRAAGSILHDFYSGIEKIFCDIASKLDRGLPKGEDWHIKLLKSMAEPAKDRARVISAALMDELKEYLGFRHIFRNLYGTQLEWDKLEKLLVKAKEKIWQEVKTALELFIKEMEG